jgi:lysophospholipase L1-like esterase
MVWTVLLGVGMAVTIALELFFRLRFGFGTPPLYVGDATIGYRLAPSQQVTRFGNRIAINEYSMRSGGITPLPSAEVYRVLVLGDSIVNGGWWTDQDAILSAQIQHSLQLQASGTAHSAAAYSAAAHSPAKRYEVINASANSWGPRNELAYLERYGLFGAHTLILVINTDDLFAVRPTAVPVGRDPNYPDRRPPLALIEVLQRYIFKPKPDPRVEISRQEEGDRVARNLQAIAKIHSHAQGQAQAPGQAPGQAQAQGQATPARFLLVLTPLKRELRSQGGSLDYEQAARRRLAELVAAQQIQFVDILPHFDRDPDGPSLYRDTIHLSPKGNQRVVAAIVQALTSPPSPLASSH